MRRKRIKFVAFKVCWKKNADFLLFFGALYLQYSAYLSEKCTGAHIPIAEMQCMQISPNTRYIERERFSFPKFSPGRYASKQD